MEKEIAPLYRTKVKCPCCESEFETSRVRPSFKKVIRTDTDFCAYFKDVNPDYYVVRVCPYCGFSFTENFSPQLSVKQKRAYLDRIGSKWQGGRDYSGERDAAMAMETYKLALLSAQAVGEKDRVVAALLHHIAWLHRYEGREEEERRFLQYALEAYIRVYETEQETISSARLLYLIGELNRRLGNYHEAVRWFSRVVNDPAIMDAAMIRAAREQWQAIREQMAEMNAEPSAVRETNPQK